MESNATKKYYGVKANGEPLGVRLDCEDCQVMPRLSRNEETIWLVSRRWHAERALRENPSGWYGQTYETPGNPYVGDEKIKLEVFEVEIWGDIIMDKTPKIKDLEAEIDRLGAEVERLTAEIKRKKPTPEPEPVKTQDGVPYEDGMELWCITKDGEVMTYRELMAPFGVPDRVAPWLVANHFSSREAAETELATPRVQEYIKHKKPTPEPELEYVFTERDGTKRWRLPGSTTRHRWELLCDVPPEANNGYQFIGFCDGDGAAAIQVGSQVHLGRSPWNILWPSGGKPVRNDPEYAVWRKVAE